MSKPSYARRLYEGADKASLAGLLGLVFVILLLWRTPVVYPMKILVVFFHELSHGLAAIMTGGRIDHIQLVAAEGGLCVTQGGNALVILTAGYLGSLVWGGAILQAAARMTNPRSLSLAMGVLLGLVTLLYVRPLVSFGFLFGALVAAALCLAGSKLNADVNRYALKAIGLTSLMYAPLDIITDVLFRPQLPSDARRLAEFTFIPTIIWGLLWTAVALFGAYYFLMKASKESQRVKSSG